MLFAAYAQAAPGARPGLILFVQTFGGLANFNPHVHVLAADAAFLVDGTFVALPPVPEGLLLERFRGAVLAFLVREQVLLVREHVLSEELRSRMLGWRYSGFSVHNQVRIGAEDAEGRKKLAGYMLRAPMSLAKMTYEAATGTVIYRSKMHLGLRGKGGVPSPPRELSGDARHPVAGAVSDAAVSPHPGSLRPKEVPVGPKEVPVGRAPRSLRRLK